jgi:hypothetical protein
MNEKEIKLQDKTGPLQSLVILHKCGHIGLDELIKEMEKWDDILENAKETIEFFKSDENERIKKYGLQDKQIIKQLCLQLALTNKNTESLVKELKRKNKELETKISKINEFDRFEVMDL